MILAVSTTSPLASAAIFTTDGELLDHAERHAPRNASQAIAELATEWLARSDLTGFVADLGPGSFTGTKVGVVLAKTWAWATGLKCGGISSFDLIAPTGLRCVPSRKGEFFVPGPAGIEVVLGWPESAIGYGDEHTEYPRAARLAQVWDRIAWSSALELKPEYALPPSISQPNRPLSFFEP